MLTLLLHFLIRLFFHRPHGINPGQRATDIGALFLAMEDSARRQFGTRYVAPAITRTWPAVRPGTPNNRTTDDLFFGL